MESSTYMKNLNVPPKKLRLMLPSIKKLSPAQAVKVLFYSTKRPGRIFYKAIQSAIANAKQTLKVNDDLLQFKLFTVEEGQKLKRYLPGSRGNANPIKKRYSHIKIILDVKAGMSLQKTESLVVEQLQQTNEVVDKKTAKIKTIKANSELKVAEKKPVKPKVSKTKVVAKSEEK